jgi:phospholipid N-methyltransferase
MGTIKFFKESVKNLKTVGTITRSSKYLCKGMIKPVDFSTSKVIIELGAGDGVVTEHILNEMAEDAILLSFELNHKFCEQIRKKIKDKRLILIEDDASKIPEYLEKHNLKDVNAIISAIPFTILPEEVTKQIVNTCKDVLKKDGIYVQIHYSLIPKKIYKNIFGNIDINFIPLNVPPAWVMVCNNV